MSSTAERIAEELRQEATRLQQEAGRLLDAAALLDGTPTAKPAKRRATAKRRTKRTRRHLAAAPEPTSPAADVRAPLGFKADGVTPRKRRPAKDPDYARRGARTRRRRQREQQQAARVDLRVTSSLHPTPAELEGRDVVHTTEEPRSA